MSKIDSSKDDQADLFNQALFMLDESSKDVEDTLPSISSEPIMDPESKKPESEEPKPSVTVASSSSVSDILKMSVQSTIPSASLVKEEEKPTVTRALTPLIKMKDGRYIMAPQTNNIQLGNGRVLQAIVTDGTGRGLARNGSAPNLSSLLPGNTGHHQPLSHKDVSKIWNNDSVNVRRMNPLLGNPMSGVKSPDEQEEADEEEEELGVAETYSDYMPSKVHIGVRHPDPVVETSSLSSVAPPDVWYNLRIPEHIIDGGELSALQLEAITYACQRHETMLPCEERAGYLIGDGAGVGKGRTVAGIIYENYLCGRKRALWLSVSSDLKEDAERDLADIGAKISVYPLNKFKYAKISSEENGNVKKGVVFSTYSSLIGESHSSSSRYKTRLKMLLNWCGRDFDGVIVLDECHKAKNLCPTGSSKPTKTGLCVLELQQKLPNARVVYASATGASEPRNMAYMSRLGLWGTGTPFNEFTDFIQAVEKRGVGAMELVAMDMKLNGMYIARQLSFQGVSFKIEDIPVPKESIKIYNQSVKLWVDARSKFAQAADLIDAEKSMRKSMWGQFWSAHQRFFKYLCISSKVKFAVKIAKEALREKKCVVIGLQSTGEARTLEQLEEMGGELNDFVSTAKGVFQSLIERHFPAPDTQKTLSIFGLTGISLNNVLSDGKEKRKATHKVNSSRRTRSGKGSLYMEEGSGGDVSGSSQSDFEPPESESSSSEEVSDDEEDDDEEFNPFGGSDSDEDPWLKKSKQNPNGNKRKKKTKHKKSSKKPKKEHKGVNSTLKPSKTRRDSGASSSDLAGSDIDDLMDAVLGKNSNQPTSQKPQEVASKMESSLQSLSPAQAKEKASAMKRELLEAIDRLGDSLPPNTLDELIDSFGGSDQVAEMTGRKGRVVTDESGSVNYESRTANDAPLEILNLTEKKRFMNGEKLVAIISEAASSGISLQADRRVSNQRRRLHITLELPWSADRAIQQFGRTHRSNQVSAPEYMFLISELAGERRFASTVAKRLECLGALTHGDRRATQSRDLSQFNIDNKYGRAALEIVMKSIVGSDRPLVPPPSSYQGNFMEDMKESLAGVGLISFDNPYKVASLEKDYNVISKFLNRILGIAVEPQNALFQYFTETLTAVILQAKRNGRFDLGILDLGAGGEHVKVLSRKCFEQEWTGSVAKTELITVKVERGLSWDRAMNVWRDHYGSEDGFYISITSTSQGKTVAALAVAMTGTRKKNKLYQVYRPNTGLSPKVESLGDFKKRYKKCTADQAEEFWLEQYQHSAEMCSHLYWRGSCKRHTQGLPCEIGLRTRNYHVLTGSVLSVWNKVEMAIATSAGTSKMQIIRLRTDTGQRVVGTLIPATSITSLTSILQQKGGQSQSNLPASNLAVTRAPQTMQRPPVFIVR
ncbi:protein strawberry notch homolog 1-like [Watersipora subatra]|uniref:protein strawberry notch homolog 1-like n=1 Tax=Watersipora subatra TaxID=2589382 RepID=UPI00355B6589